MAANSMNLNLPVPEETTGPAWAQQLNTQLETVVAEHDHTSGKGVTLTQQALNITGDLPLNDNDLTSVRTVRFQDQASEPVGVDDISVLYSEGGELIYKDGSGNVVPLTAGGAIDVGTVGGISGLGGTTATAGFSADTFTFKDTATTYANMAHGPVILYSGDDTNPSNAVTLKSPNSLAAAYDITMPTALPAGISFLSIGTNGQLFNSVPVSLGIDTANIANNAITPAKMATLTAQRTPINNINLETAPWSSGWADIGSALTIQCTGRPIQCILQPRTDFYAATQAGIYYYNENNDPTDNENGWGFRLTYTVNGAGSNIVAEQYFRYASERWTSAFPGIAPLAYQAYITPAVGSIVIQLQARSITAGGIGILGSTIKVAEFFAFAV